MRHVAKVSGSEDVRRMFLENEVTTNRRASIFLIFLGTFFLALFAAGQVGVMDFVDRVWSDLMLLAGICCLLIFPIGRYFHFKGAPLKRVIIFTFILSCTIVFFLNPVMCLAIIYIPLLVSTLYYNSWTIRLTALECWVCFTAVLWSHVLLEGQWDILTEFHRQQELFIWQSPYAVLVYYQIPQTVNMIIIALICDLLAQRGQGFVCRQARISSEITLMNADLKSAAAIQLNTLPGASYATLDGRVRIHALMRPAKVVGGDFYDYFVVGHNIICLVADVSDKGLSAAMFMMRAKNAIRTALQTSASLHEAVHQANLTLCQDNSESMFVTAWIACINRNTGIGRYVNCGHLPPLLRHADGRCESVENSPNPMLGVFAEASFATCPLQLSAADQLLIFSDGLTDSSNAAGEHFGEQRLREQVAALDSSVEDPCQRLVQAADAFTQGIDQFDDMTVLSLKLEPGKPVRRHQMVSRADYEAAGSLIAQCNRLLESCDCPAAVRREIDVAIDEVCANIADYAYPGDEGSLEADFAIGDNYADIVISDRGIPFNPLEHIGAVTDGEPAIGGLGIMLSVNLMDSIDYTRADGANRLHIRKVWGV